MSVPRIEADGQDRGSAMLIYLVVTYKRDTSHTLTFCPRFLRDTPTRGRVSSTLPERIAKNGDCEYETRLSFRGAFRRFARLSRGLSVRSARW